MATPATPKSTFSPSKGWKKGLIGLGVFLLALFLSLWFLHRQRYVWTNDAYLDGYQITISPDIEARIIKLYVDEGDYVKKGDLLVQLDESIYNSQKQDALTNVAFLEEKVKQQKIEMEKLRDIYYVARAEYENEIISYIEFDKIEKDYRFAEAAYRVSEANLANGIAKLGVIEELLVHTKVFAPRDGAIAKRWVVAGDVASYGQPLFVLTDVKNIWVTANLDEDKVENVKMGNSVRVHVDAYPDMTFTGSVFAVRASAASQFSLFPPDNATGNFTKVVQRVPIKILLDIPQTNPPLYLYPGMSVEIDIKVR